MSAFNVLLLVSPVAFGADSSVTPVKKVIDLLNGMKDKGKAEKHAEQVQYAEYKQFCDDTITEKTRAIDEAEESIEVLKADIAKFKSDSEELKKKISSHDEDIAAWEGDVKAATKVREMENGDYADTHKDYSESVDALERAISVLKKQAYDRKQGGSFTQVSALTKMSLIPSEAKTVINTFLSQDETELLSLGAPEAEGYEFQSHGIVDMLQKLLDKFIDERTGLEKEEMGAKHAYQILMADLTDQIEQAKSASREKATSKAKMLQAKADSKGDLKDTTTTMEEDAKYLDDLKATCDLKATDFESRQQLRAEEIVAIEKAVEILSSKAVSGNAEKHLPTMLQSKKKMRALAQLRSGLDTQAQTNAAAYLEDHAKMLNSRMLAQVAEHVSADPFKKVKKMLRDLIIRLVEEANEEAEHKGWCDTELKTNKQTRQEKTEAVERLRSEMDELDASIAKLTEDVGELSKAVSELDTAMADATKLRQEEKEKNTETIKDAEQAQEAVAQALTVLKEFYDKASEATALIQHKHNVQQPKEPEIFDSPYKGMSAENGGILGMLEVIQSDFARLQSDTEASESAGQKEYDTFMEDSKVDKAQKSADIDHKSAKKQDQKQVVGEKKGDLAGTQKELDAALDYYDKLKPSCVDAGVSYEERVARRKEEIESLQEALKILNGEDIA